ncbi:phosphoadenylyl-sulfate reductase [Massilia sp. W12]|uniref:phosphoadenylyl-sulfate reductase n=1 Tax=Massilia sp. W12 TaxID=3126507 RepID=UPI0030CFED1E
MSTPAPAGFEERLAQTRAALRQLASEYQHVALASSLAAEDMVLTDLIAQMQLPFAIFTLDTGRLHAETLGMIDSIRQRYGIEVARYQPQAEAVQAHVAAHGEFAFYDSVELRKECCRIRKVEPLGRALAGCDAWITGQRRAQSQTRSELALIEHDAAHDNIKANPLADWSEEDVWHYLKHEKVPYNPLHDKGYPSIGCEPCTRAIQPGEDIRAGRWWWEQADSKECGLHIVDGKIVRIKAAA